MWGGSSLQHAYVLVDNADRWKDQGNERMDALLAAPFDGIEIAFGEFLASDAERTLEWLNHFTAYVHEKRPGVETGAVVHVGKYDSTTIEYNGEKMLYYFLPKFADPRLSVFVHTVMFNNLYDRAWGAYGHERFDEHRAFLLSQIGKRGAEYYPESACWCTFDIDVPLFLPVYADSRVREIESLLDDASSAGGELSGAMIFSSGHEWGYWLTDYSYARALYDGKAGTEAHIAHASQAFGPAAKEFESWLSALIKKQREWFLNRNLIPYLTAEDIADDLGWAAGIDTHPRRLQFRDMAGMDEAALVALRDGDLAAVPEMAAWFESSASEIESLRSRVPVEAAPWLSEFAIAARMLGVRARHQEALYAAVTSALLGDKKAGRTALDRALQIQDEARALVLSMEALYRYGPQVTASHYANNTIYPFGYLGQTHDLCFWKRQFMQAQGVVLFGAEPEIGELPSCAN